MPRLALTELSLSHFRSHKSTRLEIDERPVALFGPNGAGKTNLLEAVSMLSPGRGLRRAAAEDLGRAAEGIGWKISAYANGLMQPHEISTWAIPGTGRHVTIDDKATSQATLGTILRMVWLVPSMDRLWIEGAEGRRRFLDRMTLSLEPGHAAVSLAFDKAMRERNRLLKDQVRDAHWYAALEHQMSEAGVAIQVNRIATLARIEAAQAAMETAFPAAKLMLSAPDGTETPPTANEYREVLSTGRRNDIYAGRTLVGPHRADLDAVYTAKAVSAKLCSTGEQKALLISLIMANAHAVATDFGAPPLLLLDEVAAHLDSDRRAALYDELSALGAQAWMTGTGQELFDDLGDRAQLIEIYELNGASSCRHV